MHDHLGGLPPAVDLAAEQALAEILVAASRDGMLDAAHDLSDGGLAQALVESVPAPRRRRTRGCRLTGDPFVALFSESAARVAVVTVDGGPRQRPSRAAAVPSARRAGRLRPDRHHWRSPRSTCDGAVRRAASTSLRAALGPRRLPAAPGLGSLGGVYGA